MDGDRRWRNYELLSDRGAETFRRMYLLEQHGFYRDKSHRFCGDVMWYAHPREGQPDIILHPEGMIVATGYRAYHTINTRADEGERDRIYNFDSSDAALFDNWLRTVPKANAWEGTKSFREDVKAWGCAAILFVGGYLVVSWIVDLVRDLLGWR